MGLTKQYLRYIQTGICGAVASTWSNFVIVRKPNLKGPLCAVGTCENVTIWDLRKNEKHMVLKSEDKHEVTVIAKTWNDSHLAVGYRNGSIKIFNLKDGENTVTFQGHRNPVSCLNFDDQGMRLVSGGKDTDIIIWDVVNESGLFRLKGHTGEVTQARFMSKRNILITSSKDHVIKFWDLDSQFCFKSIFDGSDPVYDFILAKNELYLIIGSSALIHKVWKLNFKDDPGSEVGGEPRSKIPKLDSEITEDIDCIDAVYCGDLASDGKSHVISMCQDESGTYFGCHGTDSKIMIFKILSDEESEKHFKKRQKKNRKLLEKKSSKVDNTSAPLEKGLEDEIRKVGCFKLRYPLRTFHIASVEEDKAKIVAMFRNNTFGRCEVELSNKFKKSTDINEQVNENFQTHSGHGHMAVPVSVSFSSDNFAIMSASKESLKIWNRTSLQCFRTIPCSLATSCIFALEDRSAIVGTKSGKIDIYEIASGELVQSIHAHDDGVTAISLAPNKLGLVSGGSDKHVILWDFEFAEDGEASESRTLTLKVNKRVKVADEVLCLKYSSDQKYLAIGCLNNKAYIFYADTMKMFHTLYYHHQPITCIDISTDSTLIATGSLDKDIKIWSMDFGECRKILKVAHEEKITSLQFIPKSHLLFSCGVDGKVKQWDCDNFQHIITLEGHQGPVNSLSVSPNGQMVVSASNDMSIRLWSKTEEVLVLEDESEMAREREEDEQMRENIHIPGESSREIGVAGMKTSETLSSAEKLCEALDLYVEEKEKLSEYQGRCKAENKSLPEPPLHVVFKAFKVNTPDGYILEVLKRIKSSDLQESLLVLPFSYVLQLVPLLGDLLSKGQEVELISNCLFFLLRIHAGQIMSNHLFQPVLEHIHHDAIPQLQQLKDTLGYNLAALKILQQHFEENSNMFADAIKRISDKKKPRKGVIVIRS